MPGVNWSQQHQEFETADIWKRFLQRTSEAKQRIETGYRFQGLFVFKFEEFCTNRIGKAFRNFLCRTRSAVINCT
ncbi:hypothetical protein DS66_04655 [Mesotoga sp. SC_3PWM13N19]|nr:hypothetical protein DS66_04655 [Mesotoga sp. SC_3PWM13N19]